MIHNTGEDAKFSILTKSPLFRTLCQNTTNPDYFEGESTYTKISKEFEALKENIPISLFK